MKKLLIYSKNKDCFNNILKQIKASKKKVCYVTLNKSHNYLLDSFEKNKIANKVYIIDIISKRIHAKLPKSNVCTYIDNPCRLDRVSDAIKKAVKKGYKLIIFDSLSDLFACYLAEGPDDKVLDEFLKSLPKDAEFTFTCRKDDEEKASIQKILKFFNVYEKEFKPIGVS